MKQTFFSIVIITLNEEKTIGRILDDLQQQTYKNFEIIIVDSDSTDSTEQKANEFSQKFSEFRFINMKAKGTSRGRNTGASIAQYEDVVFFDADTMIAPDFFEKLNVFVNKGKLDAGTGQITGKKFHIGYSTGFFLMNWGIRFTQLFSPTAVGACMYSKKHVWEKIGGFDETILFGEDANYAYKVHKGGFKFGMLPLYFYFDDRRFRKHGLLPTLCKYLKANIYRFTKGEIRKNTFDYQFGHYDK